MDEVVYIYDHAIEPKEITKRKIYNEIDDFLKHTDISQFKNLGDSKEQALKARLYTYCVDLGEQSRNHPRNYLDSMDDRDIETILSDVNSVMWI
ncbi:hypothetical protein [Shouchella clausii]|nr:hypothetical protein [Shouchella clausii]